MKLRPRMIQFDRDPRTGQYAANAPLPSPRAMQAAYGQGGATATRNVPLPNDRAPSQIRASAGRGRTRRNAFNRRCRGAVSGTQREVTFMLIPGVSILTCGEALGHSLTVDDTLLSQLQAEINRRKRIQVKLNHRGGLDTIVGWIENARMGPGKLIGDLELCKSSPSYNFVRELVSKFSGAFGLSPAFTGNAEPLPDGRQAARCKELLSVDLVESPASNPTGLFEAKLFEAEFNGTLIAFEARPLVHARQPSSPVSHSAATAVVERLVEFANDLPSIEFRRRDDDDDEPKASVGAHLTSAAIDGVLGTYVTDSVLRRVREGKWENPLKGTLRGHGKKVLIGAGVGAASAALPAWAVEEYRKRRHQQAKREERESKLSPGALGVVDEIAKRKRTEFARLTDEEQRQRSLLRRHSYREKIREREVDDAVSSFRNSGIWGAVAGGAIGNLRSKAKIGAGIGALAGAGSIKAIRTVSPADEYGSATPERRMVERAVPITAGVAAAIAAKKKLNQVTSRAAQNIGRGLANSTRLFT